jgi:hypothetical protein
MYNSFLNEWCQNSTTAEVAQNARHTIEILADEYEIDLTRARAAFADWFLTFAACHLPHELLDAKYDGIAEGRKRQSNESETQSGFTVQVVDNMIDKNVVEERTYEV